MVQSVEFFSIPLLNLGLLLGAFPLLLGGAEIFTNSVEWLGHQLGVSESVRSSYWSCHVLPVILVMKWVTMPVPVGGELSREALGDTP